MCEQEGSLIFLTCPNCGKLVLACEEEGSLFLNPKNLKQQISWSCDIWQSTFTKCPYCNTQREFGFSTNEEIQQLGFDQKEYG